MDFLFNEEERRQWCFITCLENILTCMCVPFLTISPWNPDGVTNKQACPFCRRTYLPGAAFRDHIKYCQVRDHTAPSLHIGPAVRVPEWEAALRLTSS